MLASEDLLKISRNWRFMETAESGNRDFDGPGTSKKMQHTWYRITLEHYRSIGWPMVQAGISTILSVSPLLLIDSYMVLVFIKTIFLVIGLGLLHGIVFLPVLLLTIGASTISDKPPPHPPLARTYVKNKFERVLSVPQPSAGSQGKESLRRIEASHSLWQCTI